MHTHTHTNVCIYICIYIHMYTHMCVYRYESTRADAAESEEHHQRGGRQVYQVPASPQLGFFFFTRPRPAYALRCRGY